MAARLLCDAVSKNLRFSASDVFSHVVAVLSQGSVAGIPMPSIPMSFWPVSANLESSLKLIFASAFRNRPGRSAAPRRCGRGSQTRCTRARGLGAG